LASGPKTTGDFAADPKMSVAKSPASPLHWGELLWHPNTPLSRQFLTGTAPADGPPQERPQALNS